MKSYRKQKRKRGDISITPDEGTCVDLKKPANGQMPRSSLESKKMPHSDPPLRLEIPSTKIKLQLFPIDEQTRLGLEKDGHNPFLELTLSAQKRISSVVRHLNAKWSCSSTVTGQLMLFPYNTKSEQVTSCRRWTLNDSAFTAWEVYVDVGCPSNFRLRYGWLYNNQPKMFGRLRDSSLLEAHTGSEGKKSSPRILEFPNNQEGQINESCGTITKQCNAYGTSHPEENELRDPVIVPTGLVDDKVSAEPETVLSTSPWDDNMTVLSIGGLLSEISLQGKINGSDHSSVSRSCVQPSALTSHLSFRDLLSEDSLFIKMRCPSMKLGNESSLQPLILGSSDVSMGGLFSEASLHAKKSMSDTRQKTEAGHAPIQSPWDDNFTTLSIGGLLSEVSLQANMGSKVQPKENKFSTEPPSLKPKPSMHEPTLSIFDAEETCHAFPIRKLQSNRDTRTSSAIVGSGGCSNDTSSKQSQFPRIAKTINGMVFPKDSSCQGFEDRSFDL